MSTSPSPDELQNRTEVETALVKLRDIVGPENLILDAEEVRRRSKDTTPAVKQALGFIYPGSVEEVQAIVRLANEFHIPLWPVSTGRNWGYGGSSAARDGSLIVGLYRMNRIIEVNEEMAYAVIEPGVTYRQFNTHIKESGVKLWTDSIDGPPNGSVTGNALDRGMGVTDYCDHFGNVCGMEVVLPNGELMRTGGGRFDDCKTWNVHKWGVGPYLEGLFTQSNFGIVTKIGIWMMPTPEAFCAFALELHDDKNLPALVDDLRRLALRRILAGGCHFYNDVVALTILTQYPRDQLASGGSLSEDQRAKLRKEYGVSHWAAGGGTSGTHAQVRANRAIIKKTLARYGRIEFMDHKMVALVNFALGLVHKTKDSPFLNKLLRKIAYIGSGGKSIEAIEVVPHLYNVLTGNPSDYFVRHGYFKSPLPKPDSGIDAARDDCGIMWLAPIAPTTGKNVQELIDLCEPLFKQYNFDFYVASLMQNPRAVIVLMSIMYVKDNADEAARALALYDELARVTEAAGYQQYRTGVAYMDRILDQAPAFKDFANRLKAAADPNNIMAPGKYGLG
jgi:4-cresol dehydrogenase (hydroxylating)